MEAFSLDASKTRKEPTMTSNIRNRDQSPRLIGDMALASLLAMSGSWVRGERHKRRNGLPHTFNIDPVMIGSSPRYRIEDVEAFIEGLISVSKKGGRGCSVSERYSQKSSGVASTR